MPLLIKWSMVNLSGRRATCANRFPAVHFFLLNCIKKKTMIMSGKTEMPAAKSPWKRAKVLNIRHAIMRTIRNMAIGRFMASLVLIV